MKMQVADQAATALAFKLSSAHRGQRRWRRRRIRLLDVMPAKGLLVVEIDGGIAIGGARPCAIGLDEERPVRLVGREALRISGGLVVDLAHRLAKAERLHLVFDSRLLHQSLAVDGRARKTDASLEGGAGKVLDDYVCMVDCARDDASAGGTHMARRCRAAERSDE